MVHVLIDTDVILDHFFDREPYANFANVVFGLCETGKIRGYVTPVICSNTYYILRKTAGHGKVIKNLKMLLSITNVLSMDREVILQAIDSDFRDFEDALQNFAAAKSGKINMILTRNLKDYAKSKIAVLTPESFIKSLA